MTDGAKGGRKAKPDDQRDTEDALSLVPASPDKQGGEDLWQRHKAERGIWSQGMLEALERGIKGNKWFSLIDKVYADRTLEQSWEKVKSNAGACGVDGITIESFGKQAKERLLVVKEQLQRGDYRPQQIRRVWMDKPGSKDKRPLGIPTVRDRVVQTATRWVIEPIFERNFAPQSYGFRPGRSCKQALKRVDELLQSECDYIVDIDIRSYFDTIPHERLMELVNKHIADGRVLGLIEAFLKAGVMGEVESWEPEEGTPQGGVISPLLANIYLDPLDWLVAGNGLQMVRYADDMVVLCHGAQEAQRAMELIGRWMRDAGLQLHPEKTRIVDMRKAGSHFDFLGYRFWRTRKGKIGRLIRPKSIKKLKATLKPQTRRANGQSMKAIIEKIQPVLRGWYGYFKHARTDVLKEIDGWVRNRLRAILRKRKKHRGRARGRDYHRWPNRYFDTLGLFSLEAARSGELSGLRYGAKC
jgi:RNA-directed DNA polymerase